MNSTSTLHRSHTIDQMDNEQFDLIVIGGGITGAGIALDAASRGMKVALIEKDDFASGTSSRSTKLIHGGLRYLKQFEIALVREVGQERAIVHRLAPHLVLSEKMLLPLIEGGTFGKFSTSIGLKVYDFLAGVEGDDKRVMLSREETMEKEPLVRKEGLRGSGFYAEYRTDDARLTIELIKMAAQHQALSLNYVKAEGFIYDEQQKVVGVKCKDQNSDRSFEMHSKYIISAAGPWVDKLRKKDNSFGGKRLFLSKGVHLVVSRKRFPLNYAVYFDVPDGRMIFAIPRQRVTYIGTTDTPYDGDINHVVTNSEDEEYLLKAVNNMFPDLQLRSEDVESSWAGLRPLIYEEGKSASEMSRKDEIFESETGLISIAGGKLTGYRKMAQRVVDLVVQRFEKEENKRFKDCHTDKIPFGGGPFNGAEDVETYIKALRLRVKEMGLEEFYADYLVYNYGRQTDAVLQQMTHYKDEPEVALARAEVWFGANNELVLRPLDYFSRRSGRLYFNVDTIEPVLEAVLDDFQQYFDWSDSHRQEELELVRRDMHEARYFEYSKT
ncbi:MAG: FAD-dependent oxidoreductase [Bacteroidota bacterium]